MFVKAQTSDLIYETFWISYSGKTACKKLPFLILTASEASMRMQIEQRSRTNTAFRLFIWWHRRSMMRERIWMFSTTTLELVVVFTVSWLWRGFSQSEPNTGPVHKLLGRIMLSDSIQGFISTICQVSVKICKRLSHVMYLLLSGREKTVCRTGLARRRARRKQALPSIVSVQLDCCIKPGKWQGRHYKILLLQKTSSARHFSRNIFPCSLLQLCIWNVIALISHIFPHDLIDCSARYLPLFVLNSFRPSMWNVIWL